MVLIIESVNRLIGNIREVRFHRLFILAVVFLVALAGSMSKSFSLHAEYVYAVEKLVGGDKHLHFLMSFLIGYTITWATPLSIRSLFFNSVGWPVFAALSLVVSDEVIQVFFPSREFSVYDLAANVSGVLCGILIYKLLECLGLVLNKISQ
jgi:VanZ family protein